MKTTKDLSEMIGGDDLLQKGNDAITNVKESITLVGDILSLKQLRELKGKVDELLKSINLKIKNLTGKEKQDTQPQA